MDMSQMTLFKMARQKMSWLGQRQAVLSQNIANADTPGFRAQELEKLDFSGELRRLGNLRMTATEGRHLDGTVRKPDHKVEDESFRKVYEVNPDGNSVVLEEQMIKLGQNQMEYQLVSNIYQKHMGMLKTSLGQTGRG